MRGELEWPVQLASSASVDVPLQEGGPWIVAINGVPKARVSSDVADVLKAVDGDMQPAQIAQLLGPVWTPADVEGIVRQLAHTGIFDDGAGPAETRRVQFRPPFTVQFTLFNPAPLLESFRPVVAAMMRPAGAVAALLLLLSGLIGVFFAGPSMWRVLSTPLPLEAYLYVVAAMFVSTLLHELGHGMALTYFGGTPRRIGIMLFYLSPAFFCDVTDGWRLSSGKQRVLVALAGPLVHVALGSIAMTVQVFLPDSPLKDAAVLYGMICYAVAVLNLFPFIKLDGYVALMSAVDLPHLRKKSMDELADVVRSRVLGSRRASQDLGYLPWFGLASFLSGIAFMVIGYPTARADLPAAWLRGASCCLRCPLPAAGDGWQGCLPVFPCGNPAGKPGMEADPCCRFGSACCRSTLSAGAHEVRDRSRLHVCGRPIARRDPAARFRQGVRTR